VLDVFTYEEDTPTEVGDEPWNSFARTVRNGEPFVGDCDDFALTCAELLLARGVPADEVHVITCYTETGVYHAVALAGDWVLDNRHRSVRSRGAVPYRWKLAMRLDQPGRWRKFSSSA
jgi:predicted transglutaminase-like cysteine proteinase